MRAGNEVDDIGGGDCVHIESERHGQTIRGESGGEEDNEEEEKKEEGSTSIADLPEYRSDRDWKNCIFRDEDSGDSQNTYGDIPGIREARSEDSELDHLSKWRVHESHCHRRCHSGRSCGEVE